MFNKTTEKIYIRYEKQTNKDEDDVVFNFLDRFEAKDNRINYLEVGSGLCRFPLMIKDKYKDFNIKCLEKNNDLVNLGREKQLIVDQGDITSMGFANDEFDIIHCAHVIEHLTYENVIKALDEMLRILKPNGYLIIRSPLMYPGFYFDIDHVRPYPPEAILNYYKNRQQQKVGSYKVQEIFRWYRKIPVLLYNADSYLSRILNFFSITLWTLLKFPQSKPTGYILILKKL